MKFCDNEERKWWEWGEGVVGKKAVEKGKKKETW